MLVIGVAIGSVAFPMIKTTTQYSMSTYFVTRTTAAVANTTSTSSTITNGSWQFSMTVKYNGSGNIVQLLQGNGIEVDANLTYVGAQSENVDIVSPLLAGGLALFQVKNNGSLTGLWSYEPPSAQFIQNMIYGRSFYDSFTILYSNYQVYTLTRGNTYLIEARPAFAVLNVNLNLDFKFTVS